MIFRSPPLDPWCAVTGQREYMVWTVDEESLEKDYTDIYCKTVAAQFENKNFLRLYARFAKKFCEAHCMMKSRIVIRVKESLIVWIQEKPSFKEIYK